MQVIGVSYTVVANQVVKNDNNIAPNKEQNPKSTQQEPSIRDLAQSIDPSNMSRNDSRAIANAIARAGGLEIDNPFITQSMILVNENGHLRNATESDAIMNEKFNMFDALKSQIEFNNSKGLSTASLEKGLEFLGKFKNAGENPEINLYT